MCALLSIIFFQWLPSNINSIGSLFGEMTWQKNILTIFIIALVVMIIPTLLMGITFPLIGKLYADDLKLLGRKIGNVYSVNTVGSIAGSFSAGFLLIPFLGIQKGILLMAFINLVMGIVIIYMRLGDKGSRGQVKNPRTLLYYKWGGVVSALIIVFAIVRIITAEGDMGFGYNLNGNILFSKEDVTATVKVVENRNSGFRTLMVNNYSLATSGDVAVRFGHIPLLLRQAQDAILHDKPEDVLVISLGSGITLGAVGQHPVKNIECVEIVPAAVEASRFFEKENHNIVKDPRVKLTLWDGRNYVLTTQRKYDVIISDLFQPDSAGTGNLYSIEHYRNCKDKLKKGGFMAQWLPLYQLSTEDLKVIMATFSQIFSHITVWYGDINSIKPTLLLLGSEAPLQIDISLLQEKMRQDGVLSDMLEKDNVLSLLSFFIMDEKGVSGFIDGSPLNTDDKPYIEFSAPKYIWSRSRLAARNFEELSRFRELPDSILNTNHSPLTTYFKGRGHIIQGRIYHADGLFDKEMEEYRMAEMENPFDPYLGFAYFDMGYEYYSKGMYKDAVPGLERARLINRDLKEAQFYLAKSYYQLGMKSEYEEILRQNPACGCYCEQDRRADKPNLRLHRGHYQKRYRGEDR
ncbi:MAG: fused MFS/spermidine synthase [Nitrospinae bacterium]|nr:fused MFS/spermidine synthase [Nitrospinota bacterium]